MKTRYSPLVSVKKNIMQNSERALQSANENLLNARMALRTSLEALAEINTPTSGQISDFLSSRSLFDSQRAIIKHNENWVEFTQSASYEAKEHLKLAMIEFEKFNYLELEEIKIALKKIKIQESKDLDEVALMTYKNKRNKKETS